METAAAPLFDRLTPELFSLLGSPNARHYWAVLDSLMDEMWGDHAMSPGEDAAKPRVVRAIEAFLAAHDPWDEDRDSPITVRAHGILNRLIGTGWLSASKVGAVEKITVRPVVAQFYSVLCEFAVQEPEFLGSKVRSIFLNLRAVETGEAGGDQYAEAAKQAKHCMAHIVNTGVRVQDLMAALVKHTSAREFVRGFFEDYVEKVFIADYSELRTKDHPLQHRAAIVQLTLQLQHHESRREELIGWYQAKITGGNREKAEIRFERDTQMLLRLREVDIQLRRVDELIRDANHRAMVFFDYQLRAPKQLDKLISKALAATSHLPDDHIALPAVPLERHASEWSLAKPRQAPRPPMETSVDVRPPTDREIAMEMLRRQMTENRMVRPANLDNYIARHLKEPGSVTSDDLVIESINDLCCYQRLLLIASRGNAPASMRRSDPQLLMLRKVRVEFEPEAMTHNGYLAHQRFIITREAS
ncbi:Wadjet anti-phage system protein JetA family protein [Dyella amyloliquefaciens]|uniref:Wadjet anti-phage system protein JetA family protein n=1 Tax=Dyella amyloliquefaciens TaxID=1770545 RepID=UPI00102E9306|nr:Wadjet anti-phage system protein JetA family protein [Dyella amyloliquefaciens]